MTQQHFYWLADCPPSYEVVLSQYAESQELAWHKENHKIPSVLSQWKSHPPTWLVCTPENLETLLNYQSGKVDSYSMPTKLNSMEQEGSRVVLQSKTHHEETLALLKEFKNTVWAKQSHLVLLVEQLPSTEELSQWLKLGLVGCLHANESATQWKSQLLQMAFQAKQQQELKWHNDEMFNLTKELTNRSLDMEKELEKTRVLQMSLLPPDISNDTDSDYNPFAYSKLHYKSATSQIHGLYLPCEAIGGDLYDMITFQDGTLGVLMSDVSGHGIPAAFITAMVKSSFYRITHHHQTPDQVLFHLNNQLADVIKTGEYSTAIYLHLDERSKLLQFAGAGHPYPYHYHAKTGEITRLQENGTPLVWVPDMPYAMQEVQLAEGDKVLLFTDGISELQNTGDEMFGEERLNTLFKGVIEEGNAGPEILDSMLMILSDFTQGQPLGDDMTMLLLEL